MKIIFDLDGTLIDISEKHYTVYRLCCKKSNGDILDRNIYWSMKRSNTPWEDILDRSRIAKSARKIFMNNFINNIETAEMTKLDQLIPGVDKTLIELGSKGHQLFLVSLRRNSRVFRQEVEELGLKSYFTKVISGHTQKEGFELKKRLIKDITVGEHSMIVGDTESDIIAGKQLGLTTVGVLSGIRNKDILSNLEADYIIGTVAELPKLLA